MNIREDPEYDPDAELQISASASLTPPKFTKKQAWQNQQHFPSKPSVQASGERFHPYNRPSVPSTVTQQVNGTFSQTPQNKLVEPISSNQRAAEKFLDEIQTSMSGPLRLKEEPIESTIPPPALALPSALAAQRRASQTQRWDSPSELQFKREQISPSFSFSTPQKDHVEMHVDLTCESADPPFSLRPSYLSPYNKTPVANVQAASLEIPGTSYSRRAPNAGSLDRNLSPHILPFQPQGNNPFSMISGDPHVPVNAPTSSHPPLSMPTTPRADDPPSIQTLTRELFDLRNNITTALNRQNTIVEELRRLNAAPIPSKLSLSSSEADAAKKARLDELEKELESCKAKQAELVKELQAEKMQRLEMETILEDIQREQKSPFVVPALLEAFVKISQASTAAIHHKPSLASNQ